MSVYRVRWSEGDDKIVVADSFATAQQRFCDWYRQDNAYVTVEQALDWIEGIDRLSDEPPLLPASVCVNCMAPVVPVKRPPVAVPAGQQDGDYRALERSLEAVQGDRDDLMAAVAALKQEKAALTRALARIQIVASGSDPDGDESLTIAEAALRGLRDRMHERLIAIRAALVAHSHELAVAAERLRQNRCCRCGAPVRLDCRDGCTKGSCAYRTNNPHENEKLAAFQQAGELLQDVR